MMSGMSTIWFGMIFLTFLAKEIQVEGRLVATDFIKDLNLVSKGWSRPYVSALHGFGNWTGKLPGTFQKGTFRRQGAVSYTMLVTGCKARFSKYPGQLTITHVRGSPVSVYLLNPNNQEYIRLLLGAREKDGFVVTVPAGVYVALELKHEDRWRQFGVLALLILPKFEETDMDETDRHVLFTTFPQQHHLIERFTID